MAMLEVENLKVQFFTPDGIVNAVDDVSFSLEEGEILGIAGESGCGKSVSCQAIMGLIQKPGKVTGGRVIFEGEDLTRKTEDELRSIRSKKISMIFQDPLTFLNPVLTIGNQVEEPLRVHLKMTPKQARERAVELLSLVGIPSPRECLDSYPHMFSGGMRQRAMIAMALACDPKLLIADEPTTALDVTVQLQIMDLVRKLQKEIKMSVIWITHDLGVLAGLAKTINIIYAGRLIESGSIDEVYKDPRHPYTKGLIGSIPRLDEVYGGDLYSIPGNPPDLMKLGTGCPFAPRCEYKTELCEQENPRLKTYENRSVACHIMDK